MYERSLTSEGFHNLVQDISTARGIGFIAAIYLLIDEWTADEIQKTGLQIACHRGCSFCCYQLVTCTEMEWEEIKKFLYLFGEKQRYWLKRRLVPMQKAWIKWHRAQGSPTIHTDSRKPFNAWLGKTCPFLDQEAACDIYPVRPIDCRTLTSTQQCTAWEKEEGSKRFRFEWELWANNLILDEQAKLTFKATTPLIHWLCTIEL